MNTALIVRVLLVIFFGLGYWFVKTIKAREEVKQKQIKKMNPFGSLRVCTRKSGGLAHFFQIVVCVFIFVLNLRKTHSFEL